MVAEDHSRVPLVAQYPLAHRRAHVLEAEVLRLAMAVTMDTEDGATVGPPRVIEVAPAVTVEAELVAATETGVTHEAVARRVLEGVQRYDFPHSFVKSRVFVIPTTGCC